MNLSAVIITKNEEINIEECIKSLSFCDEIIVIDDYSTDNTVIIAKELGAKIFKRALNSDFAAQRNFGLQKAKYEWVLFVDADERVTEALASEITNYKLQITNDIAGYYFRRIDYMWGKFLTHGEVGTLKLIRLAKKGAGKWMRKVHEYWDVEGKKSELKNPLMHYPHPTLSEFLDELNIFSTLHAKANRQEGKRSTLVKIIVWPIVKFLQNYILRFGFLDGVAGFVLAVTMSLNSYLSWSKLWFYQKRQKN